MQFSNLKIGTRLAAGFVAVLLLAGLTVGIGIAMLERLNNQASVVEQLQLPRLLNANAADHQLGAIAVAVRNLLLNDDPAVQQRSLEAIASARKSLQATNEELFKTLARPAVRDALREHSANYDRVILTILDKQAQGLRSQAIETLNRDLLPIFVAYSATLEDIKQYQVTGTKKATAAVSQIAETSCLILAGLGVAALVVSAVLGWIITRSITRPLADALRIATTVAQGDLTQRIDVTSTDETGRLLAALRDMSDSLGKVVVEVRKGSEAVATATREIATGNTDLSARTEQQAASLQETASSMEQLTSTVRQNAENAKQGSVFASNASEVATRTGEVVGRVVQTMHDISESSGKVAEIIGTIEGIAFQTNILALNASVEAARAGEQGKGFAVVASEVRTLAQRTAAAAKEIKELIDESVGRVKTGQDQVNESGRTIDEVVSAVQRLTDLMGEITAASVEQHSGIEQVNRAVVQMDEVTQQNAALVEQAAAAAGALQDQAEQLVQRVGVFKVTGAAARF
ncbi:chemotaxis protein [Burkholderia sp. SRS-W-2-2016]|uniref:methyl-accepting chemotaxis protein n=1 Tax=Burkholderia sp. SRS-W-2-2016 TaxID=1926878 RepID=UPI00094B3618|nr:methyl-accepting chemotaxis protein [Burkholderia sp. SRS-W-2-2016]OLL28222.1 chemotaxis protein [Burkholderia sp. SRS-W-2-2016]